MVTGLVDMVMGFFTGDKDRMGKGIQSIKDGARKYIQGKQQAFMGAFKAVSDFVSPVTNWLNTYLFQPLGTLFQAIGMRITQGFQAYIGFIQTYIIAPVQAALTFIGSAIAQGFQALLGLVQTYVVAPVQVAFTTIGSVLSQGFYALVGLVQTYIIAPLQSVFAQIQAGIAGAVSAIMSAWQNFVNLLVGAFRNLGSLAGQVGSMISSAAMSGIQALGNAIKNAILNAANFISGGALKTWATGAKPANSRGGRAYDGNGGRKMGLGSAISSEMRNKPSGSHLVIANSSETVIPAAGGYGTKELFATLQQGFANTKTTFERISQGVNINRQDMLAGFQQSEQKDTERANATNGRIDKYQQTTASQIAGIGQNVASLAAKVKEMSSFGGMMGGMGGGGGAGGGAGGAGGGMATGSGYGSKGSQIAGQLGTYIKQTGGAPGSIHEHPQHGGVKGKHSPNSYHYQGRAIDIGAYAYEQGGVLARIAQFNQKMGVKPVELLKAGDPGHNDHVHVAYAFGKGNPALFSSKQAAQKFEKSMVPSSVKVGSITGNSAEGFGGSTNVTNNITIQQLPGQSADELAMIVANKISEAVADARAASILV
jgi:hypothetical protein